MLVTNITVPFWSFDDVGEPAPTSGDRSSLDGCGKNMAELIQYTHDEEKERSQDDNEDNDRSMGVSIHHIPHNVESELSDHHA